MSGPVSTADTEAAAEDGSSDRSPTTGGVEISASRESSVGGHRVRRALPQRHRRTIGAWCFADHIGPVDVAEAGDLAVGPHPHIGLQTATWLLEGEVVHRDSLGTEQPIRPGQLNLMTAGGGVSHAEEGTGRARTAHGIQLWIAQPESTRHGEPAFEHHGELPRTELPNGVMTVLVGEVHGTSSPARRDTAHVGADLDLRPGITTVEVAEAHEHGIVVLEGDVAVEGEPVTPGRLAYLAPGRAEIRVSARDRARLLLLGGERFESPILMWWNFVARSREEIDAAVADWRAGSDRFGETDSGLGRIDPPAVPWRTGA